MIRCKDIPLIRSIIFVAHNLGPYNLDALYPPAPAILNDITHGKDFFPLQANQGDLMSVKSLPPSSLSKPNGMAHSYAAEYLPISRLFPDPKGKRKHTVHPASRVNRCKFFSDITPILDRTDRLAVSKSDQM